MVKLEQKFVWGEKMRKIRILHCADIHFDTPFKELPTEVANNSREELLEVFKKIIDLAIDENVQVVFIAGDVFDNFTVSKSTLLFIVSQLNRIKDRYVFISPGNHDPFYEKSFYNIISWPDHVHIFKGKMSKKEINELDLVVYGAGFLKKYEKETLINIESVDSSKINMMILHGDISYENSKTDYNPINIKDISSFNIDYIALGHIHKFSGILKECNSFYAYSGCPQGRGFDEDGTKGVILGEVYKGGVELSFIPINKREYVVKEIDISDCNTYEDIREKLIISFDKKDRLNNLYKIILIGKIESHLNLNIKVLIEKLKNDYYFIKVLNNTSVAIDLEEISNDYSIRGQFVKLMLEKFEKADDEKKEIISKALNLGLQCLSEDEVKIDDN